MCTFRDYRETSKTNETLIYLYIPVDSFMEDVFVDGKPIIITVHAIRRARQRNIAFPDQVYAVLQTGKRKSIGKNGIKFTKKTKDGSLICIGENVGNVIVIKTVERGN